ncbi:hypothetical protein LSTR_LSTR000560 [Laodelphax striatellus]|uniref:Uncharacterized protein n=1 Tax=Laodelphax striatellus TaxID=195883 RepID=A0A482XB65_LAOST|nr:hypothetical protein LSTR_LSTR000560 [Laodelphax striatellus]
MKTMEALDNPSYFSLAGAAAPAHESKFSLLRRRGLGSGAGGGTASLTLPSAGRRSSLRTLVLGSPRPRDLAPEQRPGHRRRASSSASDLLPPPPALPTAASDDDGDVFVTGEATYYNLTPASASTASRRRHSIGTFLRTAASAAASASAHAEPAHSLRKRCDKCTHKPAGEF